MPLSQRRRTSIRRWRRVTEVSQPGWHGTWESAGRPADEAVAAQLEQAARQARDRGGYAATVTFLSRAAELSAEEGPHARRLLAAAQAALIAGQPGRAGALLEEATPRLGDPLARAQARRLQGTIRYALGQPAEAAPVLLAAARELRPADPRSARQTLLEAVEAARSARLVGQPGGLAGDSGRGARNPDR